MDSKFGKELTALLFDSLTKMKRYGILSATFNIPDDTISIVDTEETLVINLDQYDADQDKTGQKKKLKEICSSAICVAKDLHTLLTVFSKLPQNPPMRDKAVFSKKKYYRNALLDYVKMIHQNDREFQFFKGAQRVTVLNENISDTQADDQPSSKVSIKIQEASQHTIHNFTNIFKDIASRLAENIYQSVNREINEQMNRELSRRRELRFHVEMFKAYTRLQALCALNLSREQGETTRSQAKALVVKYFPNISLPNMSLMLQRAPRIYRLLLLTNGDWRLIDSFEELSSCFFKSSMKSAANFDIWLNLVKTGQMVDYKEGSNMLKRGKKEMKNAKLDILKSYFDGINEDLEGAIIEDEEEEH